MLKKKNKEINIISKKTAKNNLIRERHIVDSAQIIDFVDLNSPIVTDIGSGGGMPGIIISIICKNLKKSAKLHLYEKSHHKSVFLRNVSRELKLNTKIIQQNIFEPLPIVLDLVYRNFKNYKNLILFMGKNGENILVETLKNWEFDFEKKKSITSDDSFLLNIKNIKKKMGN